MRNQTAGLRPVLAVSVILLLASCAGPSATRGPAPPVDPEPPVGPVARTIQGYRIQILTTNEQEAADDQVEAVIDWYDRLSPDARPPYLGHEDLDVDVVWKAPYYRVQVGSFASREEAQEALDRISRRFSDAFLVPATVTVIR